MSLKSIYCLGLTSLLWSATGIAQSAPATQATPQYSAQGTPAAAPSQQGAGPVSYASVTQLNGLLSQLEATSKTTQADLNKLRIERFKTDASYKKQLISNVDSIQRNLQGALPEMLTQLRSSAEDLPATFKLYRNLDALYDVLGNVVESAGAFGSKDDFQMLSNDLRSFEGTRKELAERIANLASAKEAEITRLRADLKAAQTPPPLPKKTVVDDNEAPKRPASRKKPAKKPPVTPPAQPQTPPAQPTSPH